VLPGGEKLFFRGRDILDAALDAVLEPEGHDAAAWATQVVVGGCSAGGAAVFFHLDYIRLRVPAAIPVAGLADAGFLQDLPPAEGVQSFEEIRMRNGSALWGGVHTNAACAASYGPTGDDAWRCLVPQYVAPFVATPHFLLGEAYDIALGGSDGAGIDCATVFDPNCSAAGIAAWEAYRNETLKNTAAYFTPSRPSANGGFLASCVPHCSSIYLNSSWHAHISVGGITPAEAFSSWLTGGALAPGARVRDEEPYPSNPMCVGEI
jgi:hypothetical protein